MSDNHYDLPWRLEPQYRPYWCEWQVTSSRGRMIAHRLTKDEAELIVGVANSHHALTAALEAALPHISSGIVCNQVAAALAQAKGEPTNG